VTTNVTAKPFTFLHETNHGYSLLWSLTRAAVKLNVSNLSYSRPIQPVITVTTTDTTQGEMSDRRS